MGAGCDGRCTETGFVRLCFRPCSQHRKERIHLHGHAELLNNGGQCVEHVAIVHSRSDSALSPAPLGR